MWVAGYVKERKKKEEEEEEEKAEWGVVCELLGKVQSRWAAYSAKTPPHPPRAGCGDAELLYNLKGFGRRKREGELWNSNALCVWLDVSCLPVTFHTADTLCTRGVERGWIEQKWLWGCTKGDGGGGGGGAGKVTSQRGSSVNEKLRKWNDEREREWWRQWGRERDPERLHWKTGNIDEADVLNWLS